MTCMCHWFKDMYITVPLYVTNFLVLSIYSVHAIVISKGLSKGVHVEKLQIDKWDPSKSCDIIRISVKSGTQ